MFRLLDRYILFKFLKTYVFTVLILLAVLIVIDATEKNEDFITKKPGLYKIVFDYYLNFIPYYANLLSPITIFIATVFVTSRLAVRTEIIAILSSGVSFPRLLWPYVMGSSIVAGVILGFTHFVVPNSNKTRVAFERVYVKEQYYFDKRDVHIKVAPQTYAYLESYNNQIHNGYMFTLETIRDSGLVSKLKAERIIWQADKQKWQLENVSLRQFQEGKERILYLPNQDTVLNLLPKDFESTYLLYETMTTPELNEFIHQQQVRGADNINPYLIEKYIRYTSPFAIIILTMIGVILSARKTREGAGLQIALGFVLAFVYILLFLVFRSVASVGSLDPILATWMPNIIFSIVGIILYNTVPR